VSAVHVARPAVLRRIPLDRHTVIEASAGTGKTFTLEHLVVEILLGTEATVDQLALVTFTEKATTELRDRVRQRLGDIVSGKAPPPTELQMREGDFWRIDPTARRKLERALASFDAAAIATIHAFCQRVLRENAFFGGRLFEEQQVDGREAFGRAFREALRRKVACDADRAPWLESALRAGRSMRDIEDLLWECAQARAELEPPFDAATFGAAFDAFPVDEAQKDSSAVLQRCGLPAQTVKSVVRKFYQLAEAVTRAREGGSVPDLLMELRGVDFSNFAKLEGLPIGPGPTASLLRAALGLARTVAPFDAAFARMILPPVLGELSRRKREAGHYDFDDMLALVDQGLRGPGGGALAAAMRARWRYALIDEFQDTDETQWSIFRQAFYDTAEHAAGTVLYLIGDPKQSIYRFRGADVDTYLRARDEVTQSGGARLSLEDSYRTGESLVEALNAIFDRDALEPIFEGAVEYSPVRCARPDRALVDDSGTEVSAIHVFGFSGPIRMEVLVACIAREISVITNAARPWKLDGRPLVHSDVFVLTRTRREGEEIGDALRAANVPHTFYKEDGLFQTDEAKDVLALLVAIDDPDDRAARFAAWLTPFFGLRLGDVDRARDLPTSHPYVARLLAWKGLADARDFGRLFESIVSDSGIVRREIFFENGERKLTNYSHVLEIMVEYARRSHPTLRDLVLELSGLVAGTRAPLDIEGNVQRLESERRAVQIMTIHKAKGLEAPVVFVAGGYYRPRSDTVRVYHEGGRRLAWVGKSPPASVDERIKHEEREEERRLMYVALTRAQGRVYLPWSAKGEKAEKIHGAYDTVNRRIVQLARTAPRWMSVEQVEQQRPAPAPRIVLSAEVRSLPDVLLREVAAEDGFGRLKRRHAGSIVTSYTRLKGARAEANARWLAEPDERRAQKTAESIDEPALRSARSSGVFLHELLERVPLESFAERAGFGAWRARPDVAALFDEGLAVHRVDAAQRAHSERIVWAAYTTAIPLPGGERIDGLASAARLVREMDFVYPIPEAAARVLGSGFVRGSIDVAFEHRGRTFFVDWKSDSLASYEPALLGRHVAAHYGDQVRLYLTAVIKLLGIREPETYEARFGGLCYCFLRGMLLDGRGVWSDKPAWNDVVGWEETLGTTHAAGTGRSS
jgi:exodeoxyribonuclease V beta subunit